MDFLYTYGSTKATFICKQYPLVLAFALTIHKCQGMTLDSVFMDCRGAFDPGQVAVGLSRVREPSQITVIKIGVLLSHCRCLLNVINFGCLYQCGISLDMRGYRDTKACACTVKLVLDNTIIFLLESYHQGPFPCMIC